VKPPLVIHTIPPEANVRVNGRLVGTTGNSGVRLAWSRDYRIVLEKPGYEQETLVFSSTPIKKEIIVKLKPAHGSRQPRSGTEPGRNMKERAVLRQTSRGGVLLGFLNERLSSSFMSLRWLVRLIVVTFLAGLISGTVIFYVDRKAPSAKPPRSPAAAPLARPTLPEPVKPPRASNLVLSRNQNMDKIIQTAEYVLQFTNDARAQSGLPPLKSSAALAFIAQNHAENMCESRVLEHDAALFEDGWKSLDERLKLVGLDLGSENIARERWQENTKTANRDVSQAELDWRQAESTAKSLVMKWMLSDQNRTKILDPAWRHMGIGTCPCEGSTVYAVQVFSTKPGSIR
jgi:uncharacterized protein YkwD